MGPGSLTCDIQHDGVSWKLKVSGNGMTLEEVWKYNKTQDCVALLMKSRTTRRCRSVAHYGGDKLSTPKTRNLWMIKPFFFFCFPSPETTGIVALW